MRRAAVLSCVRPEGNATVADRCTSWQRVRARRNTLTPQLQPTRPLTPGLRLCAHKLVRRHTCPCGIPGAPGMAAGKREQGGGSTSGCRRGAGSLHACPASARSWPPAAGLASRTPAHAGPHKAARHAPRMSRLMRRLMRGASRQCGRRVCLPRRLRPSQQV